MDRRQTRRVTATGLEMIVGGASILLGIKPKLGAALLLLNVKEPWPVSVPVARPQIGNDFHTFAA